MKLGYARVSTSDQKATMQIAALVEAGVAEDKIFIDQMSGSRSARDRPAMSELLKYAREGDQLYVWRIDRLGRSLVDVVNTVNEIQAQGVSLYSIMDGVDPSTAHGRLQLALFASLAEYERELINERVRAGVMAAKERGVTFGQQPPKPETVETKVKVARRLISEDGKTVAEAAEAVGWSRATLYRYLKVFGAEHAGLAHTGAITRAARGRSKYGSPKALPSRG